MKEVILLNKEILNALKRIESKINKLDEKINLIETKLTNNQTEPHYIDSSEIANCKNLIDEFKESNKFSNNIEKLLREGSGTLPPL